MRNLLVLVILSLSTAFGGNALAQTFRISHFNIKELDSVKLQPGTSAFACAAIFSSNQVTTAASLLGATKPDIVSINEIQYDLPNVPTPEYQTKGKNLSVLLKKAGLSDLNQISFDPANTGMNAKTDENGHYVRRPGRGQTDKFADPVNFGLFPGQYSTGVGSRYPIIEKVEIHDLEMREFAPHFDPTQFAQKNGKPLPADIELFDKNFTHLKILIEGKPVHFVFLHTVPGHHFGNPKSINPMRNKLQLSFLEWYLTGKTDHKVPENLPYSPIPKGEPFVAVGDWNVDPGDSHPGAKHILNLDRKFDFWMPLPEITYRSQSFTPREFTRQFDYILVGPGLKIKEGKLFRPEAKRIERGCGKPPRIEVPKGFVRVTYTNELNTMCYVDVDEDYAKSKIGSDHILMWAELEIL